MAEDAADLYDIEADVDDQVAGEGMAEIVEADAPAGPVESSAGGGAAKHTLGDVVVEKRRAVAGREHIVGAAREAGTAFVVPENRGELGKERDLADGGAGLRWDTARWGAAAAAPELVANVDDAGGEVDVVPAQPEHLGEPHACERPREKERPVPAGACGEKSGELCLGKDALIGSQRMRALVVLEPVEGMRIDVTATKRERVHAAERAKDPLDRPGRETVSLQLARDCNDVIDGDQRQPAIAESGQQVAMELRAIEI
jgi:hypothetical protein